MSYDAHKVAPPGYFERQDEKREQEYNKAVEEYHTERYEDMNKAQLFKRIEELERTVDKLLTIIGKE